MEYWLSVLDEIADQTGVIFTADQANVAAELLLSASSVHSEYTFHAEPAPVLRPEQRLETKRAWWEDRSNLVGSDYVLAGQIQHLIASRFSA